MLLRSYQEAARAAFWNYIRERDGNPCIVLPTGAGKTPLLATIAADTLAWGGRCLILSHVKELLSQSVEKLRAVGLGDKVGIYSAGLKKRDTQSPVLVAGIQSIYLRACDVGAVNIVLIDEAHLIPAEGEGRYRTFLEDMKVINPTVRFGGLTATPYRLGEGLICRPEGLLNEVCYEATIPEMIAGGWLCPIRGKAATSKADTAGLHVRGGEFIADEAEALFLADEVLGPNVEEIISRTVDRRSVLLFCAGVAHAEAVQREIIARGHVCRLVTGDTPAERRSDIIRGFKAQEYRYLANVNVLTTGFDATSVDAVCLLRATLSPGLYAQMVGRGFRPHPGKSDCIILDFGGNIVRHGPVDQITVSEPGGEKGPTPGKECPQCHEVVGLAVRICPDCEYEFPPPEPKGKLSPRASGKGVLSTEVEPPQWRKVQAIRYLPHRKKGADEGHPRTLKVSYQLGWNEWINEWVCVEHPMGFAKEKARQWWGARSAVPCPDTVDEALVLAEGGCLAETLEILVAEEDGYPRATNYRLGPIPLLGDAAEEIGWKTYKEEVTDATVPF